MLRGHSLVISAVKPVIIICKQFRCTHVYLRVENILKGVPDGHVLGDTDKALG